MKYKLGMQTVEAVYDNSGSQNPLIEALPECLGSEQFEKQIRCCPPPPQACQDMSMAERRQGLALLPTVFVPLDYMYYVYDSLYRMLTSSYHTLTSRERVTKINALFLSGGSMAGYGAQAQSGALLGTPGLGKTSTLRRCLSLLPQVISHEKYLGKAFYCKQVLWLHVECPSDASQKTMAYNIVRALDMAVGSNHLDYLLRARSGSVSSVSTYIKTLCVTYNVGLLVVDEIQNVVATAQRTNRIKPLSRFLTELTNDTCTAVYFTGTILAETVFQSEEYLRRRTRGPRLLPFKPDGAYRAFLQALWPYQYTPEQAVLTDRLANQIYDYSGGIPAYISKLLEEAQAQALMRGISRIDRKMIAAAADYLAIQPPKELGTGTFLSDFQAPAAGSMEHLTDTPTQQEAEDTPEDTSPVKRLYAVPRGRKAAERDERDLLVAFKAGTLRELLLSQGMVEEVVLC